MKKRIAAGSLWFIAVLAIYELAWSLVGVPRPVGPMIALLISAVVVADPAHLFWPAPTPRRRPARTGIFADTVPASD